MCRELGLDFENLPVNFADGSAKTPEFLAINPNGRIPAIDDDGFVLWESMAINLYLARKHPSDLTPRDLEEEAQAWQWSFWVMTEVEKAALAVLFQRMEFQDTPEGRYLSERVTKDPVTEAENLEALERPLTALDGHLADRDYLLGDRFTVADLNVAVVLSWAQMAQIDLTPHPHLAAWLQRCLTRPAFAPAGG
jgi:glutathione S-transferase